MKLSVVLFLLFLSVRVFAEFPLLDEPSRKFKQGFWDLQTQFTYFEATANYNPQGGTYASLPNAFSYHLLTLDFGAHYGWTRKWGVYVTSQVASAESKDGINTRTNTSLTQAVLGTDYLFYSSENYELFPDLSMTIPLQRVDPSQDKVVNSEGAMEFSGRLVGRAHWQWLEPFAFLGFTYRDEGRSALMPYGVGGEGTFRSVKMGGELRGYQTVINDQYSNDPLRRQIVAFKNGNSLKFYSVDQSLLETNFWLRSHGKGDFAWKVGGGFPITGAATAAGWSLFAGISLGLDGTRLGPRNQRPPPETLRFQEETSDGVNQRLFQTPVPPPPPPPPRPHPSPQTTRQPAPGKTKIRPSQQIQSDLNQTEFQIELRRQKKKKSGN